MPPINVTPYYPITVARNLRFDDANGIPVTVLPPVAATQALDNPATGYISLIGSRLSDLIDSYNQVVVLLGQYNTRITALETAVSNIQTSGVTFQLYVNGGCLLGNTTVTVPAAVTSLIANTCAYNTVLGTTTALSNAILAQCSNLNSAQAYSQNSTMSGLSGWISSPTTTADTVNNLWKTVCDLRGGFATLWAAVSPSCSQVIVDYQAVLNTGMVFVLYFDGYTFIPSGYTDNTSNIRITDTSGNFYTTNFNIVTQSTTTAPVSLYTSGSTLSTTSAYYTVQVTSNVVNSTLGTSCSKVVIKTVQGTQDAGLFDVGNYTGTMTSGATSLTFVSGLSYTPSTITPIPKNAFTSKMLYHQNYQTYLGISGGSGTLYLAGATEGGTVNLDYISYR